MSVEMHIALSRLEIAIGLIKLCDGDWLEAWNRARDSASEGCKSDWEAIADLIIIATHGAPQNLSYFDLSFPKGNDEDGEADLF